MNRLADASSAYLRAAADQPVDWYPWGEAPFARALELGRPVLLDVGASWCHYCHVMDEECYRDAEIATFLNESYVAVRVDADERPDLDARYQLAVAQLTGSSGWPLTAFLAPDGTVFFGGTYFSRRPSGASPGFLQILTWARELFRGDPEKRAEEGERLRRSLAARAGWARGAPAPESEALSRCAADLLDLLDRRHGGFGAIPKFLNASAVDLLLRAGARQSHPFTRDAALHTLLSMSRGGVHDRVGGGFHRYAVDESWETPHFEKLLANQAEMLAVLARAAAATDPADPARGLAREELADAARGTARFLLESLQDRERGGFLASAGADSGEGEGAAYRWSRAEIEGALPAELAEAARVFFGLERADDPRRGEVLVLRTPPDLAARRLRATPAAALARLREVIEGLRRARGARPAPPTDPAYLPSSNALAAGALLEAGRLLAEPAWIEAGLRAARRLLAESQGGELPSRGGGAPRLLADGAAAAEALALAYEASVDGRLLDGAEACLRRAIELCWDSKAGAFVDRAPRAGEIAGADFPVHPFEDGLHASGNALALRALDRVLLHREIPTFREHANRLAATVAKASAALEPLAVAAAVVALDRHRSGGARVVIVGIGEAVAALERAAASFPDAAILAAGARPAAELPADLRALAAAAGGAPAAFLCRGRSCSPPLRDPEDLSRTLRESPQTPSGECAPS